MTYEKKFVEGFLQDLINTNKINDHKIYIRPTHEDTSTFRDYINLFFSEKDIIKLLKSLKYGDELFIHWYDLYIGKLILKNLDKRVILKVVHWGGDFFQDPSDYFETLNYDKITREILRKESWKKFSWKQKLKYIFFKKLRKSHIKKTFLIKQDTVSRIDYLALHPANIFDYKLTEEIYNTSFKGQIPFFYNLNTDEAFKVIIANREATSLNKIKILLGNSSNESNNHFDALEFLKTIYLNKKVELIIPLAYGNEILVTPIINDAKKLNSSTISPILNLMERNEYIKKLNTVDFALFFHNRSQAFGNIITLLALGKPIFMKPNNTLYQLIISLKIWGVFPISELENYETIIQNFTLERNLLNQTILNKNFSDDYRLNCIKNL